MEYSWIVDTWESQGNEKSSPMKQQSCNMVGLAGLLVQIILGLLSFTVLIFKKIYEKPPRPSKIWALDSSKQVLSALFAHLSNMLFSIIQTNSYNSKQSVQFNSFHSQTGYYNAYGQNQQDDQWNVFKIMREGESGDACNYYFVTVIFDTSMGVFIACALIELLDSHLKRMGCEQMRSGNYYKESKVHKQWRLVDSEYNEMLVPLEEVNYIEIDYLAWLLQLAIWLSITCVTKIILFLMQVLLRNYLGVVSYYLLVWLNTVPVLKLIFVMIFMPTLMNGLQFWIQDNVLKKRSYTADTEEIEEIDSGSEQYNESNAFQFQNIQKEDVQSTLQIKNGFLNETHSQLNNMNLKDQELLSVNHSFNQLSEVCSQNSRDGTVSHNNNTNCGFNQISQTPYKLPYKISKFSASQEHIFSEKLNQNSFENVNEYQIKIKQI